MNKVERDKLIEENLCLINIIANKYINKIKGRYEVDELISEGFLGLVESTKTFKPTKEVKFETWANRNIEYKIKDLIYKDGRYRRQRRVDDKMVWENVNISSLNMPVSEEVKDEKVNQLMDDFSWDKVDNKIIIQKQLSILNEYERSLITDLYLSGMKQEDVAKKHGLKRSTMAMRKAKILKKIMM